MSKHGRKGRISAWTLVMSAALAGPAIGQDEGDSSFSWTASGLVRYEAAIKASIARTSSTSVATCSTA